MAKPKPWEGSPADNKADKSAAKKKGVSTAKYEGSAADRKADAAAQKKKKKKRGAKK